MPVWRWLICASVLLALSCPFANAGPPLKDGDIVFQTSTSSQSVAVQRATGSRYSHMGMVVLRKGKPYVLEASATVRYTPLADWIAHGVGGHVVAKRLHDADTRLTPAALGRLRAAGDALAGRPYDRAFGWSDDRVYCSELVWKAYERGLGVRIGTLQKIRDFNLADPVVRAAMRQRYGRDVPLDETVISPVAMFDSPLLDTVMDR